MATHSSTLAWKIPWMEEPSRLQSSDMDSYMSSIKGLQMFPVILLKKSIVSVLFKTIKHHIFKKNLHISI